MKNLAGFANLYLTAAIFFLAYVGLFMDLVRLKWAFVDEVTVARPMSKGRQDRVGAADWSESQAKITVPQER